MRVFIVLLIVFNFFDVMFGQEYIFEKMKPNSKLICKQSKTLTRKIKKNDCFSSPEKLNYLFIYIMELKREPTPARFVNNEILNEISFVYKKKKGFPENYTIIYNDKMSVIGFVEYLSSVHCFHSNKSSLKIEYETLVKYNHEVLPEIIFRLNMTPINLYFSIKNNNLKVLLFDNNKFKTMDVKEFINKYWDDYFPEDVLQIHYQQEKND